MQNANVYSCFKTANFLFIKHYILHLGLI